MKINSLIIHFFFAIVALCLADVVVADPMWTFTPLTATTLTVPSNDTAIVQYRVTNSSQKPRTLSMQSIQGITQLTAGLGVCGNPIVLGTTNNTNSCTLSLQVNGSELTGTISEGPNLCEQNTTLRCYRPTENNNLHITQASPITTATITVTGSPLMLTTNGPSGTLTINNTSLVVTATNIMSNFTNTALNGYVVETGNTCASVLPQGSCTLTYTPGSTVVSQTDFPIQGTNTNVITAAIQIDAGMTLTSVSPASGSAAGGTGITLTGSGFTGTTSVKFGEIDATAITVVDSGTVTAVTPPHAAGAVDVIITSLSGSATLTNGYTYLAIAVGQSAYGGVIGCLDQGNHLIAAVANNPSTLKWGVLNTTTGATSTTDGATNTQTIVDCLSNPSSSNCPGNISIDTYAAGVCDTYEVDSQGNTPCQSGTCYHDWFLPAMTNGSGGQLNCLYANRNAIGGFSGNYWSSTEVSANNAGYLLGNGSPSNGNKLATLNIRCVRSFS